MKRTELDNTSTARTFTVYLSMSLHTCTRTKATSLRTRATTRCFHRRGFKRGPFCVPSPPRRTRRRRPAAGCGPAWDPPPTRRASSPPRSERPSSELPGPRRHAIGAARRRGHDCHSRPGGAACPRRCRPRPPVPRSAAAAWRCRSSHRRWRRAAASIRPRRSPRRLRLCARTPA
eukprot:7039962-Prymnesium_polylepis.2